MRFRKKIVQEISDRLVQLGLNECPVCHAGRLAASRVPVILRIGGLGPVGQPESPDENVLFMVRVTCDVCGYSMLFDSEKHHGPDEPVLIEGSDEDFDPDAD